MTVIGIIKNKTTPKISTDETLYTISASDSHRGGGGTQSYCIGNGQLHDAMHPIKDVCRTLNCMCDPMKILIVRSE